MCPASAALQIRLARLTDEPKRSSLPSTGSPAAIPILTRSSGPLPARISRQIGPGFRPRTQRMRDIVERGHDAVARVLHFAAP